MQKVYITAANQLTDAYSLALDIYESGYRPDFVVGVWRGGTPIAIAIHEMLAWLGIKTDHIAIRSVSYKGINQRDKEVHVHGLNYLQEHLRTEHELLLVDDVFDTGLSLEKVITEIRKRCDQNSPNIKIATPWFKPANNQTTFEPDYYLHTSKDWLVFPHELDGLNLEEALNNKEELKPLASRLEKLKTTT